MRRWTWLAIVVLAVALVAVGGCKPKPTESTVPAGSGIDAGAADAGAGDAESVALPADFPADVPIYENATIDSATPSDVQGGKMYLIGMTSADDAGDVHAWYKKALEDGGWTITNNMEVGDSVGGINAEKGALKVNLSVGYGAEKKAQISLIVQPK